MVPALGLLLGSSVSARGDKGQDNIAEVAVNTIVLPTSFLSFLLDRLLQYENVDEDSSGEHD